MLDLKVEDVGGERYSQAKVPARLGQLFGALLAFAAGMGWVGSDVDIEAATSAFESSTQLLLMIGGGFAVVFGHAIHGLRRALPGGRV